MSAEALACSILAWSAATMLVSRRGDGGQLGLALAEPGDAPTPKQFAEASCATLSRAARRPSSVRGATKGAQVCFSLVHHVLEGDDDYFSRTNGQVR